MEMSIKDSNKHLSVDALSTHDLGLDRQSNSPAPGMFLEKLTERTLIYAIEIKFEHTLTHKYV